MFSAILAEFRLPCMCGLVFFRAPSVLLKIQRGWSSMLQHIQLTNQS
jgi:hypothetical protein